MLAWPRLCLFLAAAACLRCCGSHPLLPHECRVGLVPTDCKAIGSCLCYRACERAFALSGHQPYCHNTSDVPETWHELLRCVCGASRVVPRLRSGLV